MSIEAMETSTIQPDEGQNEQQQRQLVNRSSDNAETARCLTPFSHPGRMDDNSAVRGITKCKIPFILLAILRKFWYFKRAQDGQT